MSDFITFKDLVFLSPLIILLFGSLLILLIDCIFSKAKGNTYFWITILTLILSLVGVNNSFSTENPLLTNWIKVDRLGLIFTNLFLLIALVTSFLSHSFFKKFQEVSDKSESNSEYYFFLIGAVFGLILVGLSADFLTLFIGLETLSISLYILCGYIKRWKISHESALKYFLLGSVGTAFLLYGIALIYGAIGTTSFNALLGGYKEASNQLLFLAGVAFLTVGLLFKATIVPFHNWAPDVYEGATTPLTAFMAVGTKLGAFAAFVRIFLESLPEFNLLFNQTLALFFFVTLIFANIVAARQQNLRRFFAYSGISHSGYLLIPLIAQTNESEPALLYYIVVYGLATFGAFAVLTLLDKEKRGLNIMDLKGLYYTSPFLAALLTLSLLTLGGIPPTVGFFAKFYLFKVAFQAGYLSLVIVGLLATIFSAYYYLKIVGKMMEKEEPFQLNLFEDSMPEGIRSETIEWVKNPGALIGVFLFGLLLLFSVMPSLLLSVLGKI